MRDLGPETDADRALREWFAEQEAKNLDRLEEGARTITQLVTGLYGVLFAVLALSDAPAYLANPVVRGLGVVGVVAFFGALLAALAVLYPWPNRFQEDNLSEMHRARDAMVARKAAGLRAALWAFLVGTGALAALIFAAL